MSENENLLIFIDIIDNIKENIEQIELDRFQFESTIDEQQYLIIEEFLSEIVHEIIDISIGDLVDVNALKFKNTSLADVENKITISGLEKITPKHMFWVLGSSTDGANISLSSSDNSHDCKLINENKVDNNQSQERLKLGLGHGLALGLGLPNIDDSIDEWDFKPPTTPLNFKEVMNTINLKNKERKKM
jgi:hypothetical protein